LDKLEIAGVCKEVEIGSDDGESEEGCVSEISRFMKGVGGY
jgi:hypothetical protein